MPREERSRSRHEAVHRGFGAVPADSAMLGRRLVGRAHDSSSSQHGRGRREEESVLDLGATAAGSRRRGGRRGADGMAFVERLAGSIQAEGRAAYIGVQSIDPSIAGGVFVSAPLRENSE